MRTLRTQVKLTIALLCGLLFLGGSVLSFPSNTFAQAAATPPATGGAVDGAVQGALTGAAAAIPGVAAAASITGSNVQQVAGWTIDQVLKVTVVPVSYVIFMLAGWILGIVGVLFNWAVIRTVFQFATYFGNSANLLIAWGILRDIGNIMLLFGFIFMGVSTILDLPHSEFTAKRALPALIIFAVLLNFSLVAAEVVIDVTNGLSSVLATQAGQGCGPSASAATCSNEGISGAIFKLTGGNSVFADPIPDGHLPGQTKEVHPMQQIGTYLILALFTMVTALVLLAGAIMLITRAVVLMFIIITSPIGFAGMAVPPLHEMSKDWWHQLLNQAFFAPVFLLAILISIKMAQGLGSVGNLAAAIVGNGAADGAAGSTADGMQAILIFGLVIGLMLASLIAAKRMGAAGAAFATKTAGAGTFGVMGFIGQRTVGRASSALAQRVNTSSFGRTKFGGMVAGGLQYGAKATYDYRGIPGVGGLLAPQHHDIGKPKKGGFAGRVHDEEEKRKKRAKDLGNTKEEKGKIQQAEKSTINSQEAIDASLPGYRAEMAALEQRLTEQQNLENPILEAAANQERTSRNELEAARATETAARSAETAARAAGDAATIAAASAHTTAATTQTRARELAYNNDAANRTRVKEESEARLKPFRDNIADARVRQETFVNAHKDNIEFNNKAIKATRNQPQRDYANKNLHSNSILDVLGGVGKNANHHAAEAILKELDKSDEQKLADSYKAAADAIKAAGGGGGHGPAPAAGAAPAPH